MFYVKPFLKRKTFCTFGFPKANLNPLPEKPTPVKLWFFIRVPSFKFNWTEIHFQETRLLLKSTSCKIYFSYNLLPAHSIKKLNLLPAKLPFPRIHFLLHLFQFHSKQNLLQLEFTSRSVEIHFLNRNSLPTNPTSIKFKFLKSPLSSSLSSTRNKLIISPHLCRLSNQEINPTFTQIYFQNVPFRNKFNPKSTSTKIYISP